jgi:CRISPR-associated protein Csx3
LGRSYYGGLLKIDGRQSLPVAYAIAHKVAHLYSAVAIKDPKLGVFIVSIAHGTRYCVGDCIE